MSARGSRSTRSAPSVRVIESSPPAVIQVASPTVVSMSSPPVESPTVVSMSPSPAAPPPNPFAAYDERYWQRSEIVPANFATKGDLAFYSLKTDLENFQTRGNYQVAGEDLLASTGYFRTFGPRNVGGTIGNTNPDGSVGAVIGGNINNSWILHAPNDSRNTLFIAPGTKGTNWNWGKQMTIDKNGLVTMFGGKHRVGNAGHAPNSNNYSMEIYASPNNAVLETSLRFHQGSKYWRQIRADNTGFKFTDGNSGNLTPIFAGNISGNNVTATGALTVAGKNIMNEINAIKAFVKMP